tara:strand:- start:3789 stop:4133 length:345 start_codon:yes stop_codon:yes gene_type:complete
MKTLTNPSALRKTLKTLNAEKKALTQAIKKLDNMDALKPILENTQDQIDYLRSEKIWNFNFIGGGWNTVTAVTEKEAIAVAAKEYHDGRNLNPDPSSFRVATEYDTRSLLSLFY